MSYGSFGSGAFLNATFASTHGLPFTIVAWVKRTPAQWADTTTDNIAVIGEDFVDQFLSVGIQAGAGAADRVQCISRDAAASGAATEAFADTTYDDKWVPVIGVVTGIADRDVYIEVSANVGHDVTSRDPGSSLDSFIVGSRLDDTQFFAGLIAEVACFDTTALSTAAIDNLVDGSDAGGFTGPAPNTVAPGDCIGYWSLDSDQASHADESGNGGPSLAENGSVAFNADHPTITSAGINTIIIVPTGPPLS